MKFILNMIKQKLSLIQCHVLVGILLGDASLQTESKGKTYRLRICQGEEHKDYLFHLYDLFKNLTNSPPLKSCYFDKRTNKTYVRWSFATTQQACFRFYGQQFYDSNGIKKVPKIIGKLLKPRSIAYWYMDDGAQKWAGKTKAVRFCTDSFQHNQVQLLADTLRERFELETNLAKQGKHRRVAVSAKSFRILKGLIWEFLIPSMHYKFPEGN